MATAIGSVTEALIDLFKNFPALSEVPVEGVGNPSSRTWREVVLVGDDGDPESDVLSTFEQTWSNMSQTTRSENGTIPCSVISQSGSTVTKTHRTRVSELAEHCETALMASSNLSGLVFTVEIVSGEMKVVQNSQGSAVLLPFTVRYWTHL